MKTESGSFLPDLNTAHLVRESPIPSSLYRLYNLLIKLGKEALRNLIKFQELSEPCELFTTWALFCSHSKSYQTSLQENRKNMCQGMLFTS